MDRLHELMLEAAQRCAETLEDGEAGQAEEHTSKVPSATLSTGGLLLPSNAPSTLAARGQKWLEKRSEHIASTRKQLDEARRDMESKDLVFSPKINPAHKLPDHLKDRSVLDRQADWNKAREEKMARLFQEAQRKEEEECTFHPAISDTSRAHPGRLPREVREALHSPLPPRGMILHHQPGEPLASLVRRGTDETHFLERMRKAKAKREEEAAVKENKVSLREGGGGGGVWVPSSKRGGLAAGSKEGKVLHLSSPSSSPTTGTSARSSKQQQQQHHHHHHHHHHNHGVTVRAGAVDMGRAYQSDSSSLSPSGGGGGGSKGGGLSPFSKATVLLGALGEGSPSIAALPPLPPPELRPQKGDVAVAGASKQQRGGVFAMDSTSAGTPLESQPQGVKPRDLYTALFVEGGGRGGGEGLGNKSTLPPPSTDKWVMKSDQGGRVFARA